LFLPHKLSVQSPKPIIYFLTQHTCTFIYNTIDNSRQPVKHDTGNNSQATDTDIRLSQKTKASSQQHEQFRHDNCQPAVNTISTKIVDGKKKVLVNY
jgi:hypothetical protein